MSSMSSVIGESEDYLTPAQRSCSRTSLKAHNPSAIWPFSLKLSDKLSQFPVRYSLEVTFGIALVYWA